MKRWTLLLCALVAMSVLAWLLRLDDASPASGGAFTETRQEAPTGVVGVGGETPALEDALRRRAVAASLRVRIQDARGMPVGGADALLDGQFVGSSDARGCILVDSSWASAGGTLEVRRPDFLPWARSIAPSAWPEVIVVLRGRELILSVQDEGGEPIAGAACLLLGIGEAAVDVAYTDDLGACTLVPGDVDVSHLSVAAEGFAPHWSPIVIPDGSAVQRRVVLEEGLTLEVRVLGGASDLLSAALVKATWERTSEGDPRWEPWTERTGPDGVAVLRGVPARSGVLFVDAAASGFASAARQVVIDPDEDPSPVTIVLGPAADLIVRLEDEGGARYAGRVHLNLDPEETHARREQVPLLVSRVEVPAEGGAYLRGLPAGIPITVVGSVDGGSLARRDVVLDIGESRELVLIVPKLVPLRVRVTDSTGEFHVGRLVLRSSEGRRALEFVPRGVEPMPIPLSFQSRLTATGAANLHVQPGAYDLRVEDDSGRHVHEQAVSIVEGGEIDVRLTPTTELRGRLVDSLGAPVKGWTLVATAKAPSRTWRSAPTDATGGFVLERVDPTVLALHAVSPLGPAVLLADRLEAPATATFQVDLLEVPLRAVAFETGEGLRSTIEISGPATAPSPSQEPRPLLTGDDGSLLVRLPPGEWSVHVAALDSPLRAHTVLRIQKGASAEWILALTAPHRWRIDYGAAVRGPTTARWFSRRGGLEAEGGVVLPKGSGVVEFESLAPPGSVRMTVTGGDVLWEGEWLVDLTPSKVLRLP